MNRQFLFVTFLFCAAAISAEAQVWEFSKVIRQRLAGKVDTVHYAFPLMPAMDSTRLDTTDVIRHTKYIRAFNEPVLFYDDTRDQTVRFTWLRSNDHPVIIRLVLHGNSCALYWKECNGTGFDQPGKLVFEKQKELSHSAWHDFRKLADKINTCEVDSNIIVNGKTSEWLLEGKMSWLYILDKMSSPAPGSNFYKSCEYLIRLTDLVIAANEKY